MSAGGHIIRNRTELRSGKNLNTLFVPGIYALHNPTNSPGAGDYLVTVLQAREIDDSAVYIQQTLMDVSDGSVVQRFYNGTTWGAFEVIGSGGGESYDPTDVDITGGSITGMSSPVDASDVATKAYVDALAAGFGGTRASVRAATTANITLATALNSGDTIDGVVLVDGDLVLVWKQTLQRLNGIYVVGAVPARSTSFDTFAELAGMIVIVQEGTANAGGLFFCTAPDAGVIDVDPVPVTQVQFAGPNLSTTPSASQVVINNSTGGDATIAGASGTDAGVMTAAQYTKLAGIETGAEQNVPADLGMTRDADSVTVTSAEGTDSVLPAATDTLAGVLTAADKAKLDALDDSGDLTVDLDIGAQDDTTLEIVPSRGASVILPAATPSLAGLMTATQRNKLASISAGAQVNVDTNLGFGTVDADSVELTSSTGGDVVFEGATHDEAGIMTAADKIKLDNIVGSGGELINQTDLSITDRGIETLKVASSSGASATVPAATGLLTGLMSAADKDKLDGIGAGGGGVALGTIDGTTVTIVPTGDSEDEAVIPSATPTDAGLLSAADKTKLNGIEAGADNNVDTNLSVVSHSNTGLLIRSSTSSGPVDATLPLATAAAGTNLAGLLSPTEKDKITALGTAATLAYDIDGTLAHNGDDRVATQKAVKTYVDGIVGANDAMVFLGVIDASGNPNYPAANRGSTYKISVAGKIGGASGINVEIGDMIICITDGTSSGTQAGVGAQWVIIQTNIDGAVTGPASSVDNAFAIYNSTSGKIIKDSGVTLDTDTALAADSATRIATQHATKAYADTKYATANVDNDTALTADSASKVATQHATKTYIDGAIAALGSASAVSVRVATTANVAISTALNNGDSLDGVTLVTGDLVLAAFQSAGAENGIYTVGASPGRTTAWATYDSMAGVMVEVREGTLYGDMVFQGTSDRGGTIDVTALVFARYGGALDTNTSLGTSDKKVPSQGAVKSYVDTQVAAVRPTECFTIAVGDETTAITTGTAKVTFRMPYAFTVTDVRASLTTVSSSGLPTVDINEAGTTIISTKITIDANELTSTTAATPAVISDSALADDAQMTIDIDVAGTGATGLKVYIIGHRT